MGFGSCHAEIYCGAERQLHAVAVQCRAIFLRFHALGFNFRIVFPKYFQPVSLTDFITCPAQIGKEKFIVMQFTTVIKVISAYDNVIVKMFAVDMRGDDCFTVAEAFDEFHPNLIDLLRRNIFSGHKRLHEMIETNAACRMAEHLLCGEKRFVCHLANAVVTGNIRKLFAPIKGF